METNVIRKNLYFPDMQISLLWGDTIPCNNIVAFDKKGKEIWRINDILKFDKILEFTDIKKVDDNTMEAYYSPDMIFTVNVSRRKLMKTEYIR